MVLIDHTVLSAALPGASHNNELWIQRKIRVLRMFGHSSRYLGRLYQERGRDFLGGTRLDPALYSSAEAFLSAYEAHWSVLSTAPDRAKTKNIQSR
jgi:uncharacterized protein (UPF0303 family)